MVLQTRSKNKTARPAAPVMSKAAKAKAGITPAKPRAKRMSKDATILELREQLARFENPGKSHPSKEPLFYNSGSSGGDESGAETDPNSDNDTPVGGKRSRQTHDQRALKRTKTYKSFDDVRPTIRNKPSGLINTWYDTATTPSPHQAAPQMHGYSPNLLESYTPSQPHMDEGPPFPSLRSTPLRQTSMRSTEPLFPQGSHPAMMAPSSMRGPPPLAPFTESDDSFWSARSGPSHVRWESAVSEMKPIICLPRPYVDKKGAKCAVGIQDLPAAIRDDFRNTFIRRVIKLIFSGNAPWINPSIETLQREFNAAYPMHRVKLHLDDAAAVPTLRDLGILRCHIGNEAIKAVIEHLPGQYNKRTLESKPARAAYVQTLISDKQYPFIWEYFRPGNIPIGGAKLYYDDKRRGRFQSAPVLRALSVYFTAYGIRTPAPQSDPGTGSRPIGALAMAAAAVERAYQMHRTGDFIQLPNEFSATNWDRSTQTFLRIIENDLTDNDWAEIFKSLHKLSRSQARVARVNVGAPAEEPAREALLPVDPPTPPPLD